MKATLDILVKNSVNVAIWRQLGLSSLPDFFFFLFFGDTA